MFNMHSPAAWLMIQINLICVFCCCSNLLCQYRLSELMWLQNAGERKKIKTVASNNNNKTKNGLSRRSWVMMMVQSLMKVFAGENWFNKFQVNTVRIVHNKVKIDTNWKEKAYVMISSTIFTRLNQHKNASNCTIHASLTVRSEHEFKIWNYH